MPVFQPERLPSPKEMVRPLAETLDNLVDAVAKPLEDIAASMGLPTLPRPRATEILEALPDLPGPESLPVTATRGSSKAETIVRVKVEESAQKPRPRREGVSLRVV